METYNNQIFRNCFVIIHYHLTKVSSQINKRIIFEPDELSITLIIEENIYIYGAHIDKMRFMNMHRRFSDKNTFKQQNQYLKV